MLVSGSCLQEYDLGHIVRIKIACCVLITRFKIDESYTMVKRCNIILSNMHYLMANV